MTYSVTGPGRKETVSQRGWFVDNGPDGKRHFTACRFAVIAQLAIRMGYDLPLARAPEGLEHPALPARFFARLVHHPALTKRTGTRCTPPPGTRLISHQWSPTGPR